MLGATHVPNGDVSGDVSGAGCHTRLHTPKAVTYHEQPHYCRFMIGHSLGRMESIMNESKSQRVSDCLAQDLGTSTGTCVAAACREYGGPDGDCCGNIDAVSCSAGHQLTFRRAGDGLPMPQGYYPNCEVRLL